MPSFSRSGKNTSNIRDLAVVNHSFERDRIEKARGRPPFSYTSLADAAPRTANFADDLGRHALISSSPRVHVAPSTANKKEGLVFQRILKWTMVPGEEYDPNAPQQNAGGSNRPASRSAKDEKKRVQSERPNHMFLATERGAPNDYLVQFNKQVGNLAPPVGYYDVKTGLTTLSGPRLGYIVQVDRPHAPTFMAETLVNKECKKNGKKKGTFQISPRIAVMLLRDKTPNVNDLSQYSLSESRSRKSHNQKESREEKKAEESRQKEDEAEEDDRAKSRASSDRVQNRESPHRVKNGGSPDKNSSIMSPVASPDKYFRPRTSTPTSGSRIYDKKWDVSHCTIDMKGRTPRNKEGTGQSTCTGYLMITPQSADIWYRPSFEVMEITQRRTKTPDLSRSGKDYDDQILRLGFQMPDTLAQVPHYSKVDSAMNWTDMPGWYTSSHAMSKTTVQIGKQTARRSITVSAADTGVRIQFRKPSRSVSTIGYKDTHPQFSHIPGPNMKKSTSAHGDIETTKSITLDLDYNPSIRLQVPRTTGVLHLKKMGERRPITAHHFTGKSIHTITDIVYDKEYAEMQTIRPRTLSPVNMALRPGREAWGGQSNGAASGGLTGLTYWDGISENTSSLAELRKSHMPDLNMTQGREAYNPRDTADRESRYFAATLDAQVRAPISKVGKQHFDHGEKTGQLWHPKSVFFDNLVLCALFSCFCFCVFKILMCFTFFSTYIKCMLAYRMGLQSKCRDLTYSIHMKCTGIT